MSLTALHTCGSRRTTRWPGRPCWGERRGTDEVLPCEAPARNESFEGLAPAFLEVGELDLFRDETIEYAKRLMAAHVPVELHVLTGLTHTFDTFPLPIADKAFEYRSYVISQL